MSVGLAYLAKTKFGSPTAFGIIVSAVAAGSLSGALLTGIWRIRRRGLMILLVSVVLAICLGFTGSLKGMFLLAGAVMLVVTAAAATHRTVRQIE